MSGQFPEVVAAARALPWDGILDGEILAWQDGAVLPFVALQTRLGRKTPSAAIQAEVPVIFVAFDALALGPGDGAAVEPLLRTPLTERRHRLDALDLPTRRGRRTVRPLPPRRSPPTPTRSRRRSSMRAAGATRA